VIDGQVHRRLRAWRAGAPPEATRSAVDAGIHPAMHGNEQLPLVGRPTFAQYAPDGMAGVAEVVRLGVSAVAEVDHPSFGVEHDRSGLLGCEAVVVGEILQHLARLRHRDRGVVESDHALDGQLPVLRRGPAVGDPGHSALFIRCVAGATRLTDGVVGHGNSLGHLSHAGRGGRRRRCRRCSRDQGARQRWGGQSKSKDEACEHRERSLSFQSRCRYRSTGSSTRPATSTESARRKFGSGTGASRAQ
jgi:hypothetical protein